MDFWRCFYLVKLEGIDLAYYFCRMEKYILTGNNSLSAGTYTLYYSPDAIKMTLALSSTSMTIALFSTTEPFGPSCSELEKIL